MESKILQKLQQDYPSVPADVAAVVASLIEKGAGQDQAKAARDYAGMSEMMSLLAEKFSAYASLEAQVADYQSGQASAGQFKDALAVELKNRNVPEYFWAKALEIDPAASELIPAADAIESGYKAFVQEQNNARMDASLRPEMAQNPSGGAPAVEVCLKSRRSGYPLAGKLKQ